MRRGPIQAGGAAVLRGAADAREVLVVHRPAYNDWTLPKGKVSPDEYLAVTAVREVLEETGYRIRLIRQLSPTHYTVEGVPKVVQWWLADTADDSPRPHDLEADRVEWVPTQVAIALFTYPEDAAVLAEALRTPSTPPFVVVRHAKAMNRRQWKGPDPDRRLTERGRRQARALSRLFAAFKVGDLASSSSTRCTKTLAPYAQTTGLQVRSMPALSEESAHEDPSGVLRAMAELRAIADSSERPVVVCGHRPVLPAMFDFLGVAPSHVLKPAEVALVYPGDSTGASRTDYLLSRL